MIISRLAFRMYRWTEKHLTVNQIHFRSETP